MPEYIRSLIVILAIGSTVFWLARPALVGGTVEESTFVRDWKIWLTITCIAFLAQSFWIYLAITGAYLVHQRRQHDNGLALYMLVIFAVAPLEVMIPGIGPIDHIIFINHYRLISLCVLLPAAIHLRQTRWQRQRGSRSVDVCFALMLVWMLLVRAGNDSFTGTVRAGFYGLIDSALPYYVASRAVNSLSDFRRVAGTIVLVCVTLGALAVFESTRHWLVYDSLRQAWGLPEAMSTYLLREGGVLRANVSVGNAIVLGYLFIFAIAMMNYVGPLLRSGWRRRVAITVLFGGLIGAMSRGPWVGAAAMLLVYTGFGPGMGKRVASLIFGGGAAMIALLISPWGDKLISYLPFVGTVETGNVEYRARLFDVSMIVFKESPIVGDFHYLQNPIMEQMRQGAGIIDMVNTYLQIALPYGAIGLVLFLGVFLLAMKNVKRVHSNRAHEPEIERLGRALIAATVGILVTIGTVSSIGAIATIYTIIAGLSASYVRVFDVTPAHIVRPRDASRSQRKNFPRVSPSAFASRTNSGVPKSDAESVQNGSRTSPNP